MSGSDSIHFTADDYASLRSTYAKWWDGKLGRPIKPVITYGHPSSKHNDKPRLCFATAWDLSIPVTDFIESHDAYLDTLRFHGEAFPYMNTDAFGPGVAAAFMGCTPVGRPQTVWFMPPEKDIPIERLHFEFDPSSPAYRRVANLFEAAMDKWDGMCVVGMADLGGMLDILSSFRGAENLLCDLYDSPDEVKRCEKELQAAWKGYYGAINDILRGSMGYSHWFGMYSDEPSYIMQSDFSYMISPAMFDEFVADELSSTGAMLKNALYHMDGIGQIPHLDRLLKIESIGGIQWVPGDGEPSGRNWDELLSKILASGKKLISCAQNPDGSPIAFARDPGQLYFGTRYLPAEN